MDQLHREFLNALGGLSSIADNDFADGYKNFVAKVERIFQQEEQWMDDIDYPAFTIHQEQHARVLGALHNVYTCVLNGDIRLGRDVINRLLPEWFALHMSTLDAALELAMQVASVPAREHVGSRQRTAPAHANH